MTDASTSQSVIVTGAASGIGKACVEYLLTKNHNILAVDLDLDRLKTGFPKPSSNLDFCAAVYEYCRAGHKPIWENRCPNALGRNPLHKNLGRDYSR